MKNTYIVVATPEEVSLVYDIVGSVNLPPIIITGVGGLNVIKALKDLPKHSRIINVGYAGSVDIELGRVCEVSKSQLYHKVDYKGPVYSLMGDVPCYTSNDFVTEGGKGCLYDMELAFICALGFDEVFSYKKVSDHCDYDEYKQTLNIKKND